MHERERWQVIKALLQRAAAGAHRRRLPRHRRLRSFGAARFRAGLPRRRSATRVRGGLRGDARRRSCVGRRAGAGDPLLRGQQDAQHRRQAGHRPGRRGALRATATPIIINGGTTTFQMAEFLRERRLKVLTNSYPLAETADPRIEMPRRAAGRRGLSRAETDRLALRGRRDPALFGLAHVHERDLDRPARRDRGRSADRARRDQAAQARREAGRAGRQLQIRPARQPGRLPAVAHPTADHRRRARRSRRSTCCATPASR